MATDKEQLVFHAFWWRSTGL